jgi:hypothetical protein
MTMIQMKLDQQAFTVVDRIGHLATPATSLIVALWTTIPGLIKLTFPSTMASCIWMHGFLLFL